MIAAAATHGLHDGRAEHPHEIVEALIAAIRATTNSGAEPRTAVGVKVTGTTCMGKNLKAAMDARTRP